MPVNAALQVNAHLETVVRHAVRLFQSEQPDGYRYVTFPFRGGPP
jgi:hypothetical protein